MTKNKSYWIKERDNPQFDKPYYVAEGQLSKRAALRKENTLYGNNFMLEYATENEYNVAIAKLKKDGFTVN